MTTVSFIKKGRKLNLDKSYSILLEVVNMSKKICIYIDDETEKDLESIKSKFGARSIDEVVMMGTQMAKILAENALPVGKKNIVNVSKVPTTRWMEEMSEKTNLKKEELVKLLEPVVNPLNITPRSKVQIE